MQLKDKFLNTRMGRKLVVFAASRQVGCAWAETAAGALAASNTRRLQRVGLATKLQAACCSSVFRLRDSRGRELKKITCRSWGARGADH